MRVKARDTYRDALEIKRKIFGLDHPSVASTLNNLAGLLLTMNELEEARDMYEDSIRIRRKVFGENHPSVAESLNNIGLMLYAQRRYGDAQPLMEKSIRIKRVSFGSRHAIVALALHNYAVLMHKMGRKYEAETAYLEAGCRKWFYNSAIQNLRVAIQSGASINASKSDAGPWDHHRDQCGRVFVESRRSQAA
jgi:tetratricopeptide (TPR) repeat protein